MTKKDTDGYQDENEEWVTINTKGFQEVLLKVWTEKVRTKKGINIVPRWKYYRFGHGECHSHSQGQ